MTERAHELHVRAPRGRVHLAFHSVVRGFSHRAAFGARSKGARAQRFDAGPGVSSAPDGSHSRSD